MQVWPCRVPLSFIKIQFKGARIMTDFDENICWSTAFVFYVNFSHVTVFKVFVLPGVKGTYLRVSG
jgi:hypothetical protein